MEIREHGEPQGRSPPAREGEVLLVHDQAPRLDDERPEAQEREHGRRRAEKVPAGGAQRGESTAAESSTTKTGVLPPPALTLMTELFDIRVTAPTSAPPA